MNTNTVPPSGTLSKTMLKQKRKRESKRQAKLQQQQQEGDSASVNNGHSNANNGAELRNAGASDKPSNRNPDKEKIKKIKTVRLLPDLYQFLDCLLIL